ncbi:MAG: ribonuclease T2 [Pararhodobacter sp.]|nr:ribonuclease T2 [Pararhodobacter sp.]
MRIGDKARALAVLVALLLLVVPMPTTARAQDRAGAFDHYVLALSWMPAFCTLEGARREDARCAPGSALGWMVHGLWPQHAGGGWPEYCPTPARNPSRRETAAQSDLFGAAGAAWHQWNKHGRCTGLSADGYYALTRAALERLVLPAVFDTLHSAVRVSPGAVEAAFVAANPALERDMMITTCRAGVIVELRLCLTRELEPRPCDAALLRRSCPLPEARLEALR